MEEGKGESLGGCNKVQTLMMYSMSAVSTYLSPNEQERSTNMCALGRFGVLIEGTIVEEDYQLTL